VTEGGVFQNLLRFTVTNNKINTPGTESRGDRFYDSGVENHDFWGVQKWCFSGAKNSDFLRGYLPEFVKAHNGENRKCNVKLRVFFVQKRKSAFANVRVLARNFTIFL